MGFRFFRRLNLAPGLTLNLSKRGGSLSFGPRGAKLTAGHRGVRRTVGLPGTGLWYTEKVSSRKSALRGKQSETPPTPSVRIEDRLDLGFFKRLFTSQGEEDFVDGMRYVVLGQPDKAYNHLSKATHLADAAFMAGMLALRREWFDAAERCLGRARRKHAGLGRCFAKYGVDAAVSLPITPRLSAHIGPSLRSIGLALVEVQQRQGQAPRAIRNLKQLHRKDPDDPVVLLSLVELLVEEVGGKQACQRVVELAQGVNNQSELHAGILFWKGKALRQLGLSTAARDALTAAFRRKKNRDESLLRAIQYERALDYEQLGRKTRARQELEKIYAKAPNYEDVAQRLGLAAG